ncbi:methyl-accepting chemotaxis protein [Aliarcobacter butzleri]|uniref:Methyl-accepting chemotaxis protein n=1 Tax=Aliarcobacter butzleri TaxID=28197 RepID=A0AAW7PNW9_9BACT|nr:methyl-accepting chemotaxis protein [Aliarcobacter butzleri]MDN5062654.1 methyl-accepting chemotaxis protein [Aliarcobacter butzleri]MDN5065655.1 methyl-accepting chemotaxis protein [Aliarcobacter butzleri]
MFEIITKKISNKIIVALFTLMFISSTTIVYITTSKVTEDSITNAKENLGMLNASMFQTLRNTMNTGDPALIAKAEEEARQIKGVKNLTVAKSQALLELYPSNTQFTTDKEILKTFETKQPSIIQSDDKNGHSLRMIKPMIATSECLMCHANQNEGDVIGVMDLTFSLDEVDVSISRLVADISIISLILGLITIGLIFIIVRKATNPIDDLKDGFSNLLNSNDSNINLNIKSNDEIGDVAKLFNAYMDKVRDGLKQDEKVIEEVSNIIEKTSNGFFVYNVNSKAANPHVEDLKNKLNIMISTIKETLDKINETLRHYSESKYDFIMNDNIHGNLGSLVSGIKLVGNNTSEILAMIMNAGNALNQNSKTLTEASKNLSLSSNEQSASLVETAAAIEQITATIHNNTTSTVEMSKLAQNLIDSAKNGQVLANQTALSMDEINKEVSSINEAIEVIDQIAFQTNILSLNAAVEAATAGEAGKGFAVVAAEVRNLANRSAEAARQIKDIVENATNKAKEGKKISDNMIHGYTELSGNIATTLETINDVSNSSKEQEKGIVQIGNAITLLDKAIHKNTEIAKQISTITSNISSMSSSLITVASRASFLEDSLDKVCDIDLVYDTALIKVDLLNTKDRIYGKLGSYDNFRIEKNQNLKNWLTNVSASNKEIDSEFIEELNKLDESFHKTLQELVEINSNKDKNTFLNKKAEEVENKLAQIFENLNNLKKYHCKENQK